MRFLDGCCRPMQQPHGGRFPNLLDPKLLAMAGAVVNMRPDLFQACIMGVPFVDVLTTMQDESIPLTVSSVTSMSSQILGRPAKPAHATPPPAAAHFPPLMLRRRRSSSMKSGGILQPWSITTTSRATLQWTI